MRDMKGGPALLDTSTFDKPPVFGACRNPLMIPRIPRLFGKSHFFTQVINTSKLSHTMVQGPEKKLQGSKNDPTSPVTIPKWKHVAM